MARGTPRSRRRKLVLEACVLEQERGDAGPDLVGTLAFALVEVEAPSGHVEKCVKRLSAAGGGAALADLGAQGAPVAQPNAAAHHGPDAQLTRATLHLEEGQNAGHADLLQIAGQA